MRLEDITAWAYAIGCIETISRVESSRGRRGQLTDRADVRAREGGGGESDDANIGTRQDGKLPALSLASTTIFMIIRWREVEYTLHSAVYISWFINDSPLLWHSAQYPVWASLMDVVCDASVPNQPQKPFLSLSLSLTQQPSIACPFPRPSDGLPFSSNKSAQVSLAVMIHPTSNWYTLDSRVVYTQWHCRGDYFDDFLRCCCFVLIIK